MDRPRVLLAAYQCGPGMGSVSQIGWEWFSRLATRLPTTLLTHVRNREALTRAGVPFGGSEVVYVDTERFAGPLYRAAVRLFPTSEHAVFLISSLDFFLYDWVAAREMARRIRGGRRWDIVHAVTPVSTVAPTHLHRLGIPVVRGPLNAGLRSPSGFPDLMRQDASWLYRLREAGRVAEAAIGSSRHTTTFLTATRATLESLSIGCRGRCVKMSENGVDMERFRYAPWPEPPSQDVPLRILFVGRLLPFKGVPMLLEAVKKVMGEFPIELTVVGDGAMAKKWKERAEELGLKGSVFFPGQLPLEKVAERMRDSHLFCLPSVRESGGAVLLEAMATGRPVAAVAYGGPAELVDATVGRRISAKGPDAVISGFAEVFRDVVHNPESWRKRGEAGRQRAEERYGWDVKVDRAIEIYEEILKR